jgi:hypothetical protein
VGAGGCYGDKELKVGSKWYICCNNPANFSEKKRKYMKIKKSDEKNTKQIKRRKKR